MAPKPNAYQQLKALRDITHLTGQIHSAQVLQLEAFGHIILDDHSASWECTAQFEDREIHYKLVSEPELTKESFNRFRTMDTWIRELLGSSWKLRILSPTGYVY